MTLKTVALAPVRWTATLVINTLTALTYLCIRIRCWLYGVRNRFQTEANFRPVRSEATTTNLRPAEGGSIPECMVGGMYVRNGPSPRMPARGGRHWFDGDGILSGVRFEDANTALFSSHWVRTNRLQDEARHGNSFYVRIGDLQGVWGLVLIVLSVFRVLADKFLSTGYFTDTDPLSQGSANTNIIAYNGEMLALVENGYPWAVRMHADGVWETLGARKFGGALTHPFTAHPKLDAHTNELFLFGYQTRRAPYLVYRVLRSDALSPAVPIPIPAPVMMHDMALSESHAIFLNLPLVFSVGGMLRTGGSAFQYEPERGAAIGLIPRGATSADEVTWFDVAPCYVFHTAAAWDEGDVTVVLAARYASFSLDVLGSAGDDTFDGADLYEWRLDRATGAVTERVLVHGMPCEFPVTHPMAVGRKPATVFTALTGDDPESRQLVGVAKYDVATETIVGRHMWGAGRYGGECVFVPDTDAPAYGEPGFVEDAGYLVTFVYDSASDLSSLWCLDARTMGVQCVVPLGTRVAYGFHGTWVPPSALPQ